MTHTPTWHTLQHHLVTQHTEQDRTIYMCWNCYDTWTTNPIAR